MWILLCKMFNKSSFFLYYVIMLRHLIYNFHIIFMNYMYCNCWTFLFTLYLSKPVLCYDDIKYEIHDVSYYRYCVNFWFWTLYYVLRNFFDFGNFANVIISNKMEELPKV